MSVFQEKKCSRKKKKKKTITAFERLHLVTITNCSNLSVRPTNENPILVEIMSSIKKSAGHSVYTSNPGTSEYLYMFFNTGASKGSVVFHEEYSLGVLSSLPDVASHSPSRAAAFGVAMPADVGSWAALGCQGRCRSRTAQCNQNQTGGGAPCESKISPRVSEFLPISMTSRTSFQRSEYIFQSSPVLGRPVNQSRLLDCLSIFSAQIP